MKLKGISTFEQHIEKIVLAVMVVVLLAVVSLQFLTQPNVIEAGGQKIAPHQVFSQLETEVNRLQAAVNEPSPALPELKTPSLVTELERVLKDNADLPKESSVAFGVGPQIGGDESFGPISAGPIMAMTIPDPIVPTAYSLYVTADPYAVEENPELEAYLPVEQPLDTVGVSIETTVDGAATQALLREGDSGHRPIPANWWRPGVAVLEVVAERQEMGLDGQWSAATPVGRFPGAYDLMKAAGVEGQPNAMQLREIASAAENAAEAIVRPAYIPQIAGPEWVPPVDALARDEQYANMSDVELFRAKRRSLRDSITRLEKQLTEKPGAPGAGRDPGGSPDIVTPGKGGGGRQNTNPRPSNNNQDAERRKEERRVASLQRQIDQKKDQIAELEKQLADLGFPVTSADNEPRVNEPSAADETDGYFLGNEAYRVWVHDLDVVPGAVYRYRMRVKVNNPIYGKDRQLDPAQDDMKLAQEPYAYSPWSAWSKSVMVGRKSYLFLSNAEEARRTGGGIALIGGDSARVSAEVFHMYYGHYRRGSMTLEPGDMAATDVRVPEDLYLFDTALVTKEAAHDLLGVTKDSKYGIVGNRPSLPGRSNDPFDNPPTEIITIVPAPGGPRTPDRDERAPKVTPEEPVVELPEGVTKAPTRIPVQMDSVLLEVVQLPVGEGDGSKPLYHVYFETDGGIVEYRRPDQDKGTEAYELVRASYLLGRTTAEPEDE